MAGRWFVEWIIGVNLWHPAFRCNLSDIDGFELHHFSDQQLKTIFGRYLPTEFSVFVRVRFGFGDFKMFFLKITAQALIMGSWLVLQHTNFERGAYAVSADKEAAQLAGIKVKRVRLMAFGPT